MSSNQNVLGKGLSSLIPNAPKGDQTPSWGPTLQTVPDDEQITAIPINKVQANPWQPRKHFNDEKLDELAESIKEYGIIQPLIVTQSEEGYQLIAGERRLRAAERIGMTEVPVVIRKAEDQKKLEVSLIENIQRQNLNPLEEAWSYRRLMDEFGLTQEEVAQRVGKSRSSVANFVRLLALPKEVLESIENEKITFSHAKVILSYETQKEQLDALSKILSGNQTVAQASKRHKQKTSSDDPVLDSWADKVSQRLGFETKITPRRRGGVLQISYGSDEDLKSLLDQLLDE